MEENLVGVAQQSDFFVFLFMTFSRDFWKLANVPGKLFENFCNWKKCTIWICCYLKNAWTIRGFWCGMNFQDWRRQKRDLSDVTKKNYLTRVIIKFQGFEGLMAEKLSTLPSKFALSILDSIYVHSIKHAKCHNSQKLINLKAAIKKHWNETVKNEILIKKNFLYVYRILLIKISWISLTLGVDW